MSIKEKYSTKIKDLSKLEKDQLFVKFYDRFSKYVFRKVYVSIKDKEEAKDVTSDIFVILYRKLDEIDDEAALYSYLLGIIRKTVSRHVKSEIKTVELDEDIGYSYSYDYDESFKILLGLSEIDRKLIILKVFYGFTIREIATYFNMSASNIHKLYNKALNNLYVLIKGKEE
ncbi:MAG: sigma-70 family RNA polymerase sigma factor [Bacilli bacterium]|nr:sigma-70 family RNA polymerase sigma factor [Bacilli bacterium]